MFRKESARSRHCHDTGRGNGVAVDAAADGGESDAFQFVFGGQFETVFVAGGQEVGIFRRPLVNGTYRMDDIARGQFVAAGDSGLAGVAAPQAATCAQEFWSGGSMDGAVYAAAAQERAIGSIDNGIYVQARDIALHQFHSLG